jgi:hypothetical protein
MMMKVMMWGRGVGSRLWRVLAKVQDIKTWRGMGDEEILLAPPNEVRVEKPLHMMM